MNETRPANTAEFWLIVTMLFAVLVNVSQTAVPVYLGGITALVGAGIALMELVDRD